MANLIVDETLQYENKNVSHSTYKPTKIISKSGTSIALSSSNNTEVIFEITPKCMNLSKSTLDFQLQYITTTSGATKNEYFFTLGQIYISSIALRTRDGTELVSLDNIDIVSKAEALYINKMDKFLTFPRNCGGTTSQVAQGTDLGFNFFRSNALSSSVSAAAGTSPPFSGGLLVPFITNGVPKVGSDNFNEPQYFMIVANATSHAGDFYRNFSIPLGQIAPHTLLSINRSLYFGQNLNLVIRFSPSVKLGYLGDSSYANTANLDGVVTLNNLELRLAVEKNQTCVKMLVDKIEKEGLSLTIPYSYCYTSTIIKGSLSSSHRIIYNRSHGKKLLNIYTFVGSSYTSPNLEGDISNDAIVNTNRGSATLGCNKVLTTDAVINSISLNDYVLQEYKNDTYELIKPIIIDSVIGNVGVYITNRVYPLSWRQGPTCEWIEKDCINDGIDLDTSVEVVMNYTHPSSYPNNANLISYQVAVTQKTMTINSGGIITLI